MPNVARMLLFALVALPLLGSVARAADPEATMNLVTTQGIGEAIGTVRVSKTADGAAFLVNLKGLPPGSHGMHVHQNGDCSPAPVYDIVVAAGAAGGHFDPDHTGKHEGPTGQGHLGDLPALEILDDGTATKTLLAPRFKDIDAVRGHALIIHAGGDNYSDTPAPLGGGGARIACGVFK
jgi:Cu-Zn family superoxide dismutase